TACEMPLSAIGLSQSVILHYSRFSVFERKRWPKINANAKAETTATSLVRAKTRQLTKKIKCATNATTRQPPSLSNRCLRECERVGSRLADCSIPTVLSNSSRGSLTRQFDPRLPSWFSWRSPSLHSDCWRRPSPLPGFGRIGVIHEVASGCGPLHHRSG